MKNSDNRDIIKSRKGCKDIWNATMAKDAVFSAHDIPFRPTTAQDLPRSIITWEEAKAIYKKSIQGHHTYSASRYPHLANKGEIIYPVTFDEHLYGWHGGNFKNSFPGIPIIKVKYKF